MTGADLRKIRKELGLSLEGLGRACGHAGNRQVVKNTIHRYETGARPVPPVLARLVTMFKLYGVPAAFAPHDDA